jgi:hypothetical protein
MIDIHKLYKHLKASAKRRNIEFNLTMTELNYLSFPLSCPILDVPLDYKKHTEYSPSIDRIDNSKGYIDGNIQVVSIKANRMKNSATESELIKFAQNVIPSD